MRRMSYAPIAVELDWLWTRLLLTIGYCPQMMIKASLLLPCGVAVPPCIMPGVPEMAAMHPWRARSQAPCRFYLSGHDSFFPPWQIKNVGIFWLEKTRRHPPHLFSCLSHFVFWLIAVLHSVSFHSHHFVKWWTAELPLRETMSKFSHLGLLGVLIFVVLHWHSGIYVQSNTRMDIATS